MADAPGVAPPRSWRIAAVSVLWLAIALLAWVLAHWGWRWFGPAPASVSIVVPTGDWAQRVASAHLFGAAAGNAPATTESSPGIGDLRLLGVFSQRDGRGLALFRSSRGPLLVASGQEIGGGVRLVSVRRDGVTLNDAGVVREIALRPAKAGDTRRNATVASGTKSAACGIPAGYTGQVVRLNAELLGGMISAPDAWKTLPACGRRARRARPERFCGNVGPAQWRPHRTGQRNLAGDSGRYCRHRPAAADAKSNGVHFGSARRTGATVALSQRGRCCPG